LYVAPVVGVSAGYGRNVPREKSGWYPWGAYPLDLASSLSDGFCLDLNLNLLRLGVAF
jgi:hypothetical protein